MSVIFVTPTDVQCHAPSPSVSNDESCQTVCLDHSPVASHTRSQVKQQKKKQPHYRSQLLFPELRDQLVLVLHLPSDFPSIKEHHIDFVRYDTIDTGNAVRDSMKQQWSNLVSPGCTVKVKVKDNWLPLWLRIVTIFLRCDLDFSLLHTVSQ